jgi:hypothetical protein
MGAIKGNVLDADGTSLFNLFTIFGQTETTVTFTFGTDDVKTKCHEVIRAMRTALGADTYSEIIAFCGDTFYDNLISDTTVTPAYANWSSNVFLRTTELNAMDSSGFPFGGITWYNYRGDIGGTAWLAATEARFVARGVRNLFLHHMAPADFMETVNTRGQMVYAKQQRMPFDKGIEIHGQSNPLIICTRPKSLIKGVVGS